MHENSSIVIGFIAAFFTTFAFAPQALKTIKTKKIQMEFPFQCTECS